MGTIKVKPLEWYTPPLSETLQRADTIFGTYRVWTHQEAPNGEWYWTLDGAPWLGGSGTARIREAAKAQAEANYVDRILSVVEEQE